ncbi:MAG: OmpA family protein [Fluviicola sp.]|nr:OmpA family protein [Fluviicola sp.]
MNSLKNIVLLSWIIFSCSSLSAQSKRLFIFNGDKSFSEMDYPNALASYQLALSDSVGLKALVLPYEVQITNQKLPKTQVQVDSTTSVTLEQYLHHQIAWCYYRLHDYKQAEIHLQSTVNEDAYPHDRFYFGESLMNNRKYDDAITQFETYVRSNKADDDLAHKAQVSMTGCLFAKEEFNKTRDVFIKLADTAVFNAGTANFATMYFDHDKRLMFTSARPGGVIIDETQQSEYLCDLYWTELQENGEWTKATNFGRPLNSAQHDGASTFNNNDVIFYTRWSEEKRTEQHIYLARFLNMKFYEAYKLDSTVNYPGFKSIQPYVSMDGKTLYFSSNRPGGLGGMDIWKIAIDSVGNTLGQPENLGPMVNTDEDEMTPFFHEVSSTLFFASKGHGSIGGLDIYKSFFDRETASFNLAKNMGVPINSSFDDAYMMWDSKLSKGFFSSDRQPCEGGSCYDIYEVLNEPIHIYLSGTSYDKTTEEILPNCKLTFKDVKGEMPSFTMMTDENGHYEKELSFGMEWFIKCQKENYFADATSVNTNSMTQTTTITRDFYLAPIPTKEIEIEGIEYDFNSDKLRPSSMLVLDQLKEFLDLNNNISIEINSHTDARGSDVYNLDLSQRRAKSCVDYLVSKGIDPKRLIAQGFGETQPNTLVGTDKKPMLDAEGNPIILTEAYIEAFKNKAEKDRLHQKNRRTAFKVLKSSVE